MIWTENMLKAAELLGLDPENPRHRDLLEKCIGDAQAPPPTRGRPKGSTISNDDLAGFALFVDTIKPLLSEALDAPVGDREALKFVIGTFPGRVVGCEEPEMDTVLISWSPKFYPTSSGCLCDEEESAETVKFRHLSIGTLRNMLIRGRQIVRERGLTQADMRLHKLHIPIRRHK
jgi:hypothetical protein